MRTLACRVADVARFGQPIDVVLRASCKNERDWGHDSWGQAADPQDEMNERPSSTTVPIYKRMDRFELGVSDRCLDQSWQAVLATEGAEVLEKALYLFGWRRHKVGRTGIE